MVQLIIKLYFVATRKTHGSRIYITYLHQLVSWDYLLSGNKREANFHNVQMSVVKQKDAEPELVGLDPSFQICGIY